ncbi:MAG: hypothetical protein WBL65_03885 [Bryobacteraceae bacterium]
MKGTVLAVALSAALRLGAQTGGPAQVSGEYQEKIAKPAELVWKAVLMALEKSEVALEKWDERALTMKSVQALVYDPATIKKWTGSRLTEIKGLGNTKLAVWREMRLEHEIAVTREGGEESAVRVRSTMEIHETNTTHRWHLFASSGEREREILARVRESAEALSKDPGLEVPRPQALYRVAARPSFQNKGEYALGAGDLFELGRKALRDCGLRLIAAEEDTRLLLTRAETVTPVSKEAKELIRRYFTNEPLEPKEGAESRSGGNFAATVQVRMLIEPGADAAHARMELASWHHAGLTGQNAVKSPGVLENEILDSLKTGVRTWGKLGRYEFTNLSAEGEREAIFDGSASAVWLGLARFFQSNGYRARAVAQEDMMMAVTPYVESGAGHWCSYQVGVPLRGSSPTRAVFSLSCRGAGQGPRIGREYVAAPPAMADEFVRAVERETVGYEAPSRLPALADGSVQGGPFGADAISGLIARLGAIDSAGFWPELEFYPGGLKYEQDGGTPVLGLTVHLKEPVLTEGAADPQTTAQWMAERVAHPFAMALEQSGLKPPAGLQVRLRVAHTRYGLDDGTPADLTHHEFRVQAPWQEWMRLGCGDTEARAFLRVRQQISVSTSG